MFEIFERLGDLFSNGDGSHYDTSGHESVVDGFDGSTLDLSQYTPDDIEDAVRNALGTGDGLHDTSHGYDISFGAAPDVDARNVAICIDNAAQHQSYLYNKSMYRQLVGRTGFLFGRQGV